MKIFTPTVITSKMAKRRLEEIKAHHAKILATQEEHKNKVEMFHQQKAMERQASEQQAQEHQKAMSEQQYKMRQDQMAHEKERMLHEQKLKELELKRQALMK